MKTLIKYIFKWYSARRIVRRKLSISDLHKEKKRLYDLYNETHINSWAFHRYRIRIMAIEKHLQDIYNSSLVNGKQWPPRDADGNPTI